VVTTSINFNPSFYVIKKRTLLDNKLADLVVTPIRRHILGKPTKEAVKKKMVKHEKQLTPSAKNGRLPEGAGTLSSIKIIFIAG
jgi:hypothetical protein